MTTLGHDLNDGAGIPLSDMIQPGRGFVFADGDSIALFIDIGTLDDRQGPCK